MPLLRFLVVISVTSVLWTADASAQPGVSLTSTPTACNGVFTGTVTASASGGTAPYTYQWSNGATTATVTGLAAGSYHVVVTDAAAETAEGDVIVGEAVVITGTTSVVQPVSCNGVLDGALTVTTLSGTPPYTYEWNTGAVTQTITGAGPGTYTVRIVDDNGCTNADALPVVLTEPSVLVASVTLDANESCLDASDGALTASATGGTGAYSYAWADSAQTVAARTGLAPSAYTATVTDENGCTAMASATVIAGTVCAVDAGVDAATDDAGAGADDAGASDGAVADVDAATDGGVPGGSGGGCAVRSTEDAECSLVALVLLAIVGSRSLRQRSRR